MLFILSDVVFHADLLVDMHADFDVALVAADILNLELDGPSMVFRFDLDSVTPHYSELYWIHVLGRDLLSILPAGYKLIKLDLSEANVILQVLKFLLHVISFTDTWWQVWLADKLLKVAKIIIITRKFHVFLLYCVGLAIDCLTLLLDPFSIFFAIWKPWLSLGRQVL